MQTSPFLDRIRAEARKEGRAEGMRAMLVCQGRLKFGRAPTKKQHQKLEAVTDLGQLEVLAARMLQVASWAELLQAPP
jgi:hypothetical protein